MTVFFDQQKFVARFGLPLRVLFLLAATIAGAILLYREREEIAGAIVSMDGLYLGLAALAAVAHIFASFWAWRGLVSNSCDALLIGTAERIFFLGQIGKYLPGGVWQFVAAAEFGHGAGLSRRITVSSFIFALFASLAAAGAVIIATVPDILFSTADMAWWLLALAIAVIAVLLHPSAIAFASRLGGIESPISSGQLLEAIVISVATWLFAGVHLWLLAKGLGIVLTPTDIFALAGCYTVAWIAGFIVMIAPAGLGAREATLIALLSLSMPLAQATIIAILSRLLMTMTDFGAAGATLLFTRSTTSPPIAPLPLQD